MSKNVQVPPHPRLGQKDQLLFLTCCQFKPVRHPHTQAPSQFFERQTPELATRAGAPEGSLDCFGSQHVASRFGTPGRPGCMGSLRAPFGTSHCHSVRSTSAPQTPRAPATSGAAAGPAGHVHSPWRGGGLVALVPPDSRSLCSRSI